ncbi:MAG: GGDEF domain-containing protein [Eubacterium sp.]|nr:GGDEF domain-containing protein [Eubacterium sp.]
MKYKKRSLLYLLLLTLIVIGLLLTLLFRIQTRANRDNAYRSSGLLIDQLEQLIETNDDKVRSLTASLKDDYVTRSKAVSYMIDKNPEIENRITELAWLTNLLSVDEIHLFDTDGKLYSGTKPGYYGENLRTSKRFSKFAKMLDEKNFTMCEPVNYETGSSMQMMYAISWNDAHKHLVMVGITPRRLLNELSTNQMDKVIREIPAYDGVEILVANDDDNVVIGATNTNHLDRTLDEIGIEITGEEKVNNVYTQSADISLESSYVSLCRYNGYKIVVAQYISVVNKNILVPLILVSIYMLIAAVVIVLIVRRMTRRIINEHKNANTDAMTGFHNRRAFENDIKRYSSGVYEPTLVCVSMDLNGLKKANDTLGHDAGDKLIKGAASCISQCFGNYGDIYRVGGDEFVGLLFADEDRLTMMRVDFMEATENWSGENDMELSVSCGYVRVAENENLSFDELIKLADDRMYENKNEYYRKKERAAGV